MGEKLEKKLNADIEKLTKTLSKSSYEMAEYGYQAWLNENKNKTTIEKLEFKKKYIQAYVNEEHGTNRK